MSTRAARSRSPSDGHIGARRSDERIVARTDLRPGRGDSLGSTRFPQHQRSMEDIAMALSQKHRSSIYQSLSPMLGEEEAEALLSQFPSRDLDEPVNQGFVRAEIAD